LNSYLQELNEYFDDMDKDKETPREELMIKAREFHDTLLNKYPSTINVKCDSLVDLESLVSLYGTIGLAKKDNGDSELYIIE
jgi:hypothetical protein